MGCRPISFTLPNGSRATGIACSRGQKEPRCSVGLCHRPVVALCDYRVLRHGKWTTCSSPMCDEHRHPVPGKADTDFCEGHWQFDVCRRLREE